MSLWWTKTCIDRFRRTRLSRSMAASGFCPRCKTTHTLPTTSDAAAQVQQLHSSLQKSTLPQYPTIKKKGKVIGVLVCVDKSGTQTTTLKAFAGAIDGQWHVPDWSPVVGGVGTSPAELPLYQQIQQQTNVLAERQQHLRQLLVHPQYQEDNTLTCSSNSSRVANNNNTIDNSNSNSSSSNTERMRVRQEILDIAKERKALSREALKEMRRNQIVCNFRGETAVLTDVWTYPKIPAGVGDCCAPKLLADAARQGLRPVSIAEIVVGGDNDGMLRDACAERCHPIMGFMLCGIE